jgi:metallo-beta-lactamase class B
MGRLDSYIAQTERMRQLSAQWGIDVPLSNHSGVDGTVAKLKARAAAPNGPNPFVSGQPVVDRAMRVLNTCARAQRGRFQLTAVAGGAPHGGDLGQPHAQPDSGSPSLAAMPLPFPNIVQAGEHAGL